MHVWTIVIMLLLLVSIVIFVSLTIVTTNKNLQYSQLRRIIPFSASMGPTADSSTPLTGTDANGNTVSQISCPAGYNVNVLGAFFQVFDPYGECSNPSDNLVSQSISVMCGANGNINPQPIPASGSSCSTDNDCFDPNIFQCLNGHCQLRPCSSDSDCQESNNPTGSYKCIGPSGSSYCLDTNVCLGITYSASGQSFTPTGLVNPVCTPNNQTTMCALRDASAYVANKCDGQNSCNITIEDFGPYPCSFQPVGCNLDTSDTSVQDFTSARNTTYCQLPFSYGYPGGVPSNSSGQSSPGNANIGYTVHGIYTCVPQNE